ncbi:MAG: alpha-amylase family glycosyl hydrolase [Chloroflexota bacterium]
MDTHYHPPWLDSVHHDGSERYVSNLTPRLGETITLQLRLDASAPVRRVVLRTFPDGEQALADMQRVAVAPPVQWWEIETRLTEPVTHYRFLIDTGVAIWHYSAAGLTLHVPTDATDFRILADYTAPEWVHSTVFYQIFPDRFANGDPSTDPRPDEYEFRGYHPRTFKWEEPPDPEQPFPLIFYGGDLPGIQQHLDYLENLGVNGLYLNPVFTAYSNHKYDVADYENVDTHFGGNEALAGLRKALDDRGMRYLLDIVPNHAGYWHSWFQAAREDPDAPSAEYFTFHDHPDDYATWLGAWTLPKLNYTSQALRRRMYGDPDSVLRRWLQPPYSADGWRVDVANMLARQGATQLGAEVARGMRAAVKEARPDAYFMGENFFDASAQLQGDEWDGVMNYDGFTHPIWFWLVGYRQGAHGFPDPLMMSHWPTGAMTASWRSRLAAIPWVVALQQYNLLDSHDVPRIRTIVGGNDALHRLAVTLLMTFPGVPGLYYGDEIGMTDLPDLDSRGCMVWDESRWDHDLLAFHRDLIRLRRESAALQRGGFQLLLEAEDSVCYQRELLDERLLVLAHRSLAPAEGLTISAAVAGLPDGARFIELFGERETRVRHGQLSLPTQQQGASIWRQVSP